MRVLLARLAYRIGQIGQQGKVQIGIAIGEKADLEIVHQLAHLLFIEQQRGNRDQSGAFLRNAFAEVQFGQRFGIEECGDRVVDQVDRILRAGSRRKSRTTMARAQ